jgi:endonuclease/exonuclease/phosphatase (EEP) superfamily protein YafD
MKRILPRIVPKPEVLRRMGCPSQQAFGPAFSLLVWNVFKGKRRHWLRDLRRLGEQAELVLLQEAILHESSRDYFHSSPRHEWVMAQSFVSEFKRAVTGVKSGAVVPADDARFFVSPHREPLMNTPKLILVTRYPIADRHESLLAINVHAINFATTTGFGRQMAQLHEVIEFHAGPVVLAGDFNTWSRSRRDVLTRLIARLGLLPVEFGARGKIRHLNRVLDHVFVRGMKVVAARTIQEIGSSDHRPLEVRLEFLEGRTADHPPSAVDADLPNTASD